MSSDLIYFSFNFERSLLNAEVFLFVDGLFVLGYPFIQFLISDSLLGLKVTQVGDYSSEDLRINCI